MDFETQDTLAKAVSVDSLEQSTDPLLQSTPNQSEARASTTFSRIRQKRRVFGSATKADESPEHSDLIVPQQNNFVSDKNDDDEGSGVFKTTESSVVGAESRSEQDFDKQSEVSVCEAPGHEIPKMVSTPDEESSDDEMEPDDSASKSECISESNKKQEESTKVSTNTETNSDDEVELGSETQNETTVDENDNDVSSVNHKAPDDNTTGDSKNAVPPKRTDASSTTSKKIDRKSLIESTDQLFLQVTDREKVTVKDILQSLQTEYDCPKFDKESKAIVRERLTGLILGKVQPLDSSRSDPESSDEDVDGESESEASGAEADGDDSDFEATNRRKKAVAKRGSKKKKKKVATERRESVKRKSAAATKAAAVRIQAEQLRKKRLEELRVRNEELQLLQNQEEQKRAAKIAAKLETDTEEIRLARLEQRLDLLQRLDQKRFAVIQEAPVMEVKEEKKDNVKEKEEHCSDDEDSQGEESSGDDMELELVGKPTKVLAPRSPDPVALLAWADKGLKVPAKTHPVHALTKSSDADKSNDDFLVVLNESGYLKETTGQFMNARALLKKRLLSRQRQIGNRWLARELGYRTEKEHVDECRKIENEKRLKIIQNEQERIQANERKLLRERLLKAETEEVQIHDDDEDDEEDEDYKEFDNEKEELESVDEEMVMARDINQADTVSTEDEPRLRDSDCDRRKEGSTPPDAGSTLFEGNSVDSADFANTPEKAIPLETGDTIEVSLDGRHPSFEENTTKNEDSVQQPGLTETDHHYDDTVGDTQANDLISLGTQTENTTENAPATTNEKDEKSEKHEESKSTPHEGDSSVSNEDLSDAPKKEGPRNSAWREMLRREAEKLKKSKKRNGEMIDDEADEEEEEEIAGLEDFGFAMHKKKKNKDDEEEHDDSQLDEEDIKDVVDEVSDGEGDEEEGKKARKAMELREEKARHKEIMRRMREGYDGRRGGIAGGGAGARGVHRFNELVAADNREGAKQLGLLNDDEMDSENEKEENDAEDEADDEAELLDKVLKDRFLHRSSAEIEENFSEDEDDDDQAGMGDEETNEDFEEKEQERMAKRFTKRARMQRLIEAHGHEEEFSQLKLIEEDLTLKEELQKIKNGLVRKRCHSNSVLSSETSNMSGNTSSKRAKVGISVFTPTAMSGSSLALALQASRQRNKKRTSFLRGTSNGSSNDTNSSFQRSVGSFKHPHVIFQSSNSNSRASSRSNISSRLSLSSSLPAGTRPVRSFSNSSSLWSKVARGTQNRH